MSVGDSIDEEEDYMAALAAAEEQHINKKRLAVAEDGNVFGQFRFNQQQPQHAVVVQPTNITPRPPPPLAERKHALDMLVREKIPLAVVKEPTEGANDADLNDHAIDKNAPPAHWVYPESHKFPRRDYQYNIVRTSLMHNTMVCLPTGLGKTFIAATVMANFYIWHPNKKVIFMAPTKPLVTQQAEACYSVMGVPYEHVSEMTGATMGRAKRAAEWRDKRCFFVTPHIVHNDINSGTLRVEDIVCLVVDEAHKAVSNYAFVSVVRAIGEKRSPCRILALTATPARDAAGVQAIIDNLRISRLEVKSEADFDIRPWLSLAIECDGGTTLTTPRTQPTPAMVRVMDALDGQIRPLLANLCAKGAYFTTEPRMASSYSLRARCAEWKAANEGSKDVGFVFSWQAQAQIWCHARTLLRVHGFVPLIRYLEQLRGGSGAAAKVSQGAPFGQVLRWAQDFHKNGEVHPKVRETEQLLLDHFTKNPDSRVIIFTSLRASVDALVDVISRMEQVRCSRFVGQSSVKESVPGLDGAAAVAAGVAGSAASGGQKQREQREVIDRFVNGALNVLVATCVGEEGLDIGEVDLIIEYDSTSSPIRRVQRVGRTGRKRQGRSVALLSEGQEASQYDKTKALGASILKSLIRDKGRYRFHQPSPDMHRLLVPGGGRLGPPTLRDEPPPVMTIEQGRQERATHLRKRQVSSAKGKLASQQKASFLMDRFGVDYYAAGDDFEDVLSDGDGAVDDHGNDAISMLLMDTAAQQELPTTTHSVGHSSRSTLLSSMLLFLDEHENDGTFGGVDVASVMPKRRRRAVVAASAAAADAVGAARSVARPIYGDDDDNGGGGGGGEMDESYRSFLSSIDMLPGNDEPRDGVMADAEDDEGAYEPSMLWFTEAPPKAKHDVMAAASPPPQLFDDNDNNNDDNAIVVPATPPPPPPPSATAQSHRRPAVTPRQGAAHSLTTPASATRRANETSSRLLPLLDLSVLSERVMRSAPQLLQSSANVLFLPPPPPLHSSRGVVSTMDCPQCGCQFPDAVALGFHCFRQHWPALQASVAYNPNPIDVAAAVAAASSGGPAEPSTPAHQSDVSPAFRGATVAQAYPRTQHFVAPSPVVFHASFGAQSPSLSEPSSAHRWRTVDPAGTVAGGIGTAAAAAGVSVSGERLATARVVQLGMAGSASSPSLHLNSVAPSPRSGAGASDASFEVEAILDSRVQRGRTEYLIRWSGFTPSKCTWEPEASLYPGAIKLLRAFKRTRGGSGDDDDGDKAQVAPARRKPKRGRKSKGGRMGAAAFLDLEANLSGSEASSDEDEDDEDGQAPSWVVGDEEELVYSGSAPSQPLDTDVGFYRRVDFDSPSSAQPLTFVAPKRQKPAKQRKRHPVRLQRRDAGATGADADDVDVEVFASQAAPPQTLCAVCGSPARSGNLCSVCANDVGPASPPAAATDAAAGGTIVAASRDLSSHVVSCLTQRHKKAAAVIHVSPLDAGSPFVVLCSALAPHVLSLPEYILGPRLAVLRRKEKDFGKGSVQLLADVGAAQERNHRVALIVERAPDSSGGATVDRTLALLACVPNLVLLFSHSNEQSAQLLHELHERTEHFTMGVDAIARNAPAISFLCCAPDVGVARAVALMQQFATLGTIVRTGVDALVAALGVTHAQAAAMAAFFQQRV